MNTQGTSRNRPILIIRFSSLGDIILTEPATRVLRDGFPHSQIHFLTKTAYTDLVHSFEAVDRVIPYNPDTGPAGIITTASSLRKNKYRLIVDLHRNTRSALTRLLVPAARTVKLKKSSLHRFFLVRWQIGKDRKWPKAGERYLECVPGKNGKAFPARPSVTMSRGALTRAEKLVRGNGTPAEEGSPGMKSPVAMAPGARWQTKMWAWENYAELGTRLANETGVKITLLGSPEDRPVCTSIKDHIDSPVRDLSGKTTIMEAAAVLAGSSLLVTNDTGLMHLAVAVGTPVLAIFGPTSRELGFYPHDEISRVVEIDLPCRPCTTKGSTVCPLRTHECMTGITPDQVFHEALKLLEERKRVTA